MTAPLSWAIVAPIAVFEFIIFYRMMDSFIEHDAARILPSWLVSDLRAGPPVSATSRAAFVQFIRDWVLAISFLLLLRWSVVSLAGLFRLRAVTYQRVKTWSELIGECADIVRAQRLREEHIRGPSIYRATLAVHGARSMRGTVPLFSLRRRMALRSHAFRVVAALRATQIQRDSDPKEAARRLGELTLKISDRYSEGRLGVLLDDDELRPTVWQHEAVRLAVSASLIAAIALAAQAFDFPIPIVAASAVIIIAVAYRSAVMVGVTILAALYPLLFPLR
jgi:hypothetical protein